MSSIFAPETTAAPISTQFADDFAASTARRALRRAGNQLLNCLRRRAAFNQMMEVTPDIREDIGLTDAKIAERLRAVARDEEEPLPGLAPALLLLWQGWVIYGDLDSRRCWRQALQALGADRAGR